MKKKGENAIIALISALFAFALIYAFFNWWTHRQDAAPIEAVVLFLLMIVSIIWLLIIKTVQYVRR